MQVKSIAECTQILQYFQPSLSYHLALRSFFGLFFEWLCKTGFTVFCFYRNVCTSWIHLYKLWVYPVLEILRCYMCLYYSLLTTVLNTPPTPYLTIHPPSGLQIFFKICGPKWPMEQKMVGHFLKWWAQAYQN